MRGRIYSAMTARQEQAILGQLAGKTAIQVAADLETSPRAILKLWRLAKRHLSAEQRARYENMLGNPEKAIRIKPFSLSTADAV